MKQRGASKIVIAAVVIVILAVGVGIGYWLSYEAKAPADGQPMIDQKGAQGSQSDASFIGDDFTLIPPAGWIRTQIPSTLVSYQNSRETQPKGSAAEKINFKSYLAVSFDSTNGQSLVQIAELVKNQTKGVAPAISFASAIDGTIGGQPAKFMEADLLMQDVNFKVAIAVAMKGDKYFIISFNTTAEKWPEYRDIFYNALNSFKFKY